MAATVPLFLLRTVLFPHMPMGLHIFEERYKEMLRDCLEAGSSFGVVAIKEGTEVDGDAVPWEVGTLARIARMETLEDGRVNLTVTGASRFRVVRPIPGKPYARAEVAYLQEDDPPADSELRRRLRSAFRTYLERLRRMAPDVDSLPDLPAEDETLAYMVAALLDTPLAARQQLLEAPGPEERMRMELRLLRFEADLVSRRVLPSVVPPAPFSAN